MNVLTALDDPALFGAAFAEPTWRPWRAFLGALFGLDLPADLASFARAQSGRQDVLDHGAYREAWLICGRRSGKSRTLAAIAVYLAAFIPWRPRLAPGEVGVVMILAADRDQAKVLLDYVRGLIAGNAMLSALVTGDGAERIELGTLRVAIEVHTSSYRAVRGRTLVAALCDEVAFWRSDVSANPAAETVRALRPALATLAPDSLLIGASSPYSRQGLLWDVYRRNYGREGSRVLVWQAPSSTMNAGLDPAMIADELADDPEAAGAEWLAEFRRDIARFVSVEVVESCTVPGRHELPRVSGVRYHGFLDPSGGSSDSFTLAIAHRQDKRAILDRVVEQRPPFSPEVVCADYAATLKSYGITRAVADRYAGVWVVEGFTRHGVVVEQSAKAKSDLYGEILPALNSSRIELLDNLTLQVQLAGLERRTARSGKDSIDRTPGAHDDLANACAGALVAALDRPVTKVDFARDLIINEPVIDGWRATPDDMRMEDVRWHHSRTH